MIKKKRGLIAEMPLVLSFYCKEKGGMKGQIFAFTGKGFALGERLLKILDRQGMSGELFGYGRFMEKKAPLDSYPLKEQVARV